MKRPVPCIALLTDFGFRDPYVGIMKGAILSINPDARIVDISHEQAPWGLLSGAFKLRSSVPYFPDGTIFVAVVDPGVGTRRKILFGESRRHRFLAPDNGLLSMLEPADRLRSIRSVTNRRYMRPEISSTFHGRDVFGPVAAWLSLGVDPARLGPPVRTIKKVDWEAPRARKDGAIEGRIVGADQFGNLITNIPAAAIRNPRRAVISVADEQIRGLSKTYGSVKTGKLIALIGSAGTLEIAMAQGDAKAALGVEVGMPIEVHPRESGSADLNTDDHVCLLETNLDNVTGEALGGVFERLFECGALDVWSTPIQMKKSRPGVKLSVLAPLLRKETLQREILRHTPTFGVRSQALFRRKLSRRMIRVRTKFGVIRVKVGSLDGQAIRAAPEYEDVAAAARRAKVPFDAVHLAASEAGRRRLDE